MLHQKLRRLDIGRVEKIPHEKNGDFFVRPFDREKLPGVDTDRNRPNPGIRCVRFEVRRIVFCHGDNAIELSYLPDLIPEDLHPAVEQSKLFYRIGFTLKCLVSIF